MALRPGVDATELDELINNDFEVDAEDKFVPTEEEKDDPNKLEQAKMNFDMAQKKSYDYLTNEKLYDALFLLADTWCPSVNELEYKEFFSQLKWRIVYNKGMQDNQAYNVMQNM